MNASKKQSLKKKTPKKKREMWPLLMDPNPNQAKRRDLSPLKAIQKSFR